MNNKSKLIKSKKESGEKKRKFRDPEEEDEERDWKRIEQDVRSGRIELDDLML
jgi:hypothetical protein